MKLVSSNKLLQVGLTGGIGSGKSLVASIFELLGAPIYNSDQRAKYLMNHNELIIKRIQRLLGDEAYNSTGKIQSKYISDLVFNNKLLLQKLNAIVHPAVFYDYAEWVALQTFPYIIKESALLVDTLVHQTVDKIIVVSAPLSLRINRVVKRDQLSVSEVKARIQNQISQSELLKKADFVISNNEKKSLLPQILKVHQKLLSL